MTTTMTKRGRIKFLERDEEMRLAIAWLRDRDFASRDKLILHYRPLAVSMAKEVARTSGAELDDLVQEAFVALTDSIDKFDPSRGNGFGTFARWHIVGQLKRHVMDFTGPMRVGTNLADKKVFMQFRRVRADIERATGRPIDEAGRIEIAKRIGVSLDVVLRMEPRVSRSDVALDKPALGSSEETRSYTLSDEGPSPEVRAVGLLDAKRTGTLLAELIAKLPAREQTILRARLMGDERVQLHDLGERLGITKERVRQLERQAVKKLKRSLERRGLTPADLIAAL